MLKRLVDWHAMRRRRAAFEVIRQSSAAAGFDLSEFSDGEIKRGVCRIADRFARAGLTAAEMHKAMRVAA